MVFAQIVWSIPAFETVVLSCLVIFTNEVEFAHAFATTHVKVFTPLLSPVTVIVGEFNVPTVKVVPGASVHVPVPVVGVFAFNVMVAKQVVWLLPAFETLTAPCLVRITSSKFGVTQAPFVMVYLNV